MKKLMFYQIFPKLFIVKCTYQSLDISYKLKTLKDPYQFDSCDTYRGSHYITALLRIFDVGAIKLHGATIL